MTKVLLSLGLLLLMTSFALLFIPSLQHWDIKLITLFAEYRTPFLTQLASILAILGGMPVVLFITSCCCALQLMYKNSTKFILIAVAVIGSICLSWLLKFCISRSRPDAVLAIFESYGDSFPSGHSVYAATLSALIMLLWKKRKYRHISFVLAGLWLLLMGLSRIYLGVHFPSDVLAGWALGLIWVSLLWQFLHTKYRLKLLEQPNKFDKNSILR